VIYFEDLEVGTRRRFGERLVSRDEVIAFARDYDPQPFHLSDEAAAATHFGRLSASGWHSCAMTMAMLVADMQARGEAGLGSPGIDELRWPRPVFPGDTLSVEAELLEKRRSASRPEMGIYKSRIATLNQHGEPVVTFVSTVLIATRSPADG
jgi:acyl dehydratase